MSAFNIVSDDCMGTAALRAVRVWRCVQNSAVIRVPLRGVSYWRPQSAAAVSSKVLEPQKMGRMIKATGWLRASGFGSSTATFEIDLGAQKPSGHVRSEMTMIIEAMAAGRATLVTEGGRWLAIRPTRRTADGLAFLLLEDADTVETYFS